MLHIFKNESLNIPAGYWLFHRSRCSCYYAVVMGERSVHQRIGSDYAIVADLGILQDSIVGRNPYLVANPDCSGRIYQRPVHAVNFVCIAIHNKSIPAELYILTDTDFISADNACGARDGKIFAYGKSACTTHANIGASADVSIIGYNPDATLADVDDSMHPHAIHGIRHMKTDMDSVESRIH